MDSGGSVGKLIGMSHFNASDASEGAIRILESVRSIGLDFVSETGVIIEEWYMEERDTIASGNAPRRTNTVLQRVMPEPLPD